MQEEVFVTVTTSSSSQEADSVTNTLHQAGLHPAPMAVTAPMPGTGEANSYPVDVPTGEAQLAQQVLMSHYLLKNED